MDSAVTLFLATGKAMTVIIMGGVVQNGTAANIFKNNNGTLEINGLTVADSVGQVSCDCFIKTVRENILFIFLTHTRFLWQAAIETSLAGQTTVKDANFTSNNYVVR